MVVTTRRFTLGIPGAATVWNVVVVPPAK
jgi:hypothetical protein